MFASKCHCGTIQAITEGKIRHNAEPSGLSIPFDEDPIRVQARAFPWCQRATAALPFDDAQLAHSTTNSLANSVTNRV